MIKHSGLSPCLLSSALYFNSGVCRLLSVSYWNSNNISGYFTIRHSPLKLMFLVVLSKYFNDLCELQSRCLQIFISKLFVNIS